MSVEGQDSGKALFCLTALFFFVPGVPTVMSMRRGIFNVL